MKYKAIATLFALLIMSGCAPIPHNEYFAPQVSGILTINGSPLAHANVYLGSAITLSSCELNPIVAVTNQNGEFEIGPIKEFRYLVVIYGDPSAIWELCTEHKGERTRFLYQNGHFSPEIMNVRCDLEKTTEHSIDGTSYGVFGKCDLSDS